MPLSRKYPPRSKRLLSRLALGLVAIGGLVLIAPQAATALRGHIDGLTPQNNRSYNGQDGYTPSASSVSSTAKFGWRYEVNKHEGEARAVLTVDGRDVDDYNLNNKGDNERTAAEFENLGNLPRRGGLSDGRYKWEPCLEDRKDRDCSNEIDFEYNHGPVASGMVGSGSLPYNTLKLSGQLSDATNNVRPWFFLVWTDSAGRSHTIVSDSINCDIYGRTGKPMRYRGQPVSDCSTVPNQGMFAPSGTTFNSDEVGVLYFDRQRNPAPGQTLTQFLQEKVPYDASVRWYFRGQDDRMASDMNHNDGLLSLIAGQIDRTENRSGNSDHYQNAWAGDESLQNLDSQFWGAGAGNVGFKWSNKPAADFTVQSPPKFGQPDSTKRLIDRNGNERTNPIVDGETVVVESRLKNTGGTPMKFYGAIDYFGTVRDFEQPTGLNVRFESGAGNTQNVDVTGQVKLSPLMGVKVDEYLKSRKPPGVDVDKLNPWPTPDQIQDPDPTRTDLIDPPDEDDFEGKAGGDRNGAWKIDFGHNQDPGSALAAAGAPVELAPGQTIVITYNIKANRNHLLNTGPRNTPHDSRGNYDQQVNVVNSNNNLYGYYQYDYDEPEHVWGDEINRNLGSVFAPSLRSSRGDVHSNSSIGAYGASGATFVVTANGSITQFAGGLGAVAGAATIDWRKEMITNIRQLKSGNVDTNISGGLLPSGNLAGKTWFSNGDLTLPAKTFRGAGTILVAGNLTITGNLDYLNDPSAIDSLGIIVMGNVTIDPAVRHIVGSYFVLDAPPGPDGVPVVNNDGTVKDLPPAGDVTSRGIISTGSGTQQLRVDGLMIARYFNFQRYYLNPAAPADPAENVYYDGRLLAATPPGFQLLRSTAFYEIAF